MRTRALKGHAFRRAAELRLFVTSSGLQSARGRIASAFVLLIILLIASAASAHEARPAYLELKETAPNQFTVLWRTPVLAGMRLPIALALPDDVKEVTAPIVEELADSVVERHTIDAGPKGLAGKRIDFLGLQLTITDVLVRVEMLDGR